MKLSAEKEKQIFLFIFACIIFIFMYIFFTQIHPLVIYDADDWTYFSQSREAIPLWGVWNPSKVFPEIMMPLCGSIAAFIIAPVTGDYIGAFTIISAAVVSFFISLYIYTFSKMIYQRIALSIFQTIAVTLIFFLCHFWFFRTEVVDNQYLFYCYDVNCYYNYLIPSLLCFILVFAIIADENFKFNIPFNTTIKSGCLLFLCYLAIFSNLFSNIILAVFAGSIIVVNYFTERKERCKIMPFLKQYATLFLIILFWGISVLFESSGGNAQAYDNGVQMGFIASVKNTLINCKDMYFYNMNRILLIVSICIVILTIIVLNCKLAKQSKEDKFANLLLKLFISTVVIFVYYILLCAVVNTSYMRRSWTVFGLSVYCLSVVFVCLSFLVKNCRQINRFIPLLICLIFFNINTGLRTFRESNITNTNPKICIQIDNELVDQIVEADQMGLNELVLHVPVADNDDNWPHAYYLGERISNTLYKHGIINNHIRLEILPDASVNEDYHLPV